VLRVRVKTVRGFSRRTEEREITLSCAVMHTSSSRERRECVSELLSDLGEQAIRRHWHALEVFGDFFRQGVWWNAKRCWSFGLKAGATHHLVIQDDVRVCRDFVVGVFDVIAACPDEIIGLCSERAPVHQESARWGKVLGPRGQAVIMPVRTVRDFLAWEKRSIRPELTSVDDIRILLYCDSMGSMARLPLPNLVAHRPEFKSLAGTSTVPSDSYFMGDRSPREFDWLDGSTLDMTSGRYLPNAAGLAMAKRTALLNGE
jgi:hypothetical protein